MTNDKVTCKNILFFYDYFYPGYKAGGPIQSLTNLTIALEDQYNISVVTSAYDLHTKEPYKNIVVNNWNAVTIPVSKRAINVYYADVALNKSGYSQIFKTLKPAVVYFNSIYSSRFFLQPLKILRGAQVNTKVVICPRGMLQKGALAIKPLKKKIYLAYLRHTGSLNNVLWHATNEEEADDIRKHFPKSKGIVIAANIPKLPYNDISFTGKKPGELRLIYLSLIAKKKNLLQVLQLLKASENVTLDIYGPVADAHYWQECTALINEMPGKANYKGDVQPTEVQHLLTQHDALILLTQGENFGHALYESLSVGRPIITSHFTPWINLQQKKAGWNIDIASVDEGIALLKKLRSMPSAVFNEYCVGAHKMSLDYCARLNSLEEYRKLFG